MNLPENKHFCVVSPDYYDDFSCLADRCPETCCQGWNIDIDPETMARWEELNIHKHIENGKRPHICMNEGMKCPLLTETGLCSIVIAHGDSAIPKICRDFPRQFTELDGLTHRAVSLRCAPVLDLLWKKNAFRYVLSAPLPANAFPVKPLLDTLLEFGNSGKYSAAELLSRSFLALLLSHRRLEAMTPRDENGYREYGTEYFTENTIAETIQHFEHEDISDHLPSGAAKKNEAFRVHNDLILDVMRHFLESPVYGEDFKQLISRSRLLMDSGAFKDAAEIKSRSLSPETERKLRLVILEEFSTSVFSPEILDYETALVRLQWLIVQYAVIRHLLRLELINEPEIGDDCLKKHISRIFRITDLPDIQKLAFYDEDFIGWLWSPEKVWELLL